MYSCWKCQTWVYIFFFPKLILVKPFHDSCETEGGIAIASTALYLCALKYIHEASTRSAHLDAKYRCFPHFIVEVTANAQGLVVRDLILRSDH